MENIEPNKVISKNYFLLTTRVVLLILLIFAASGLGIRYYGLSSKSDFVLAIDSSASMLANDYYPTRLDAAKDAALVFINEVPYTTNIGVVTFSGNSIIKQGLSKDISGIKEAIKSISTDPLGGTDLSGAIMTSANMLTNEERTKTIILLTDGRSNIGLPIEEAINYANKRGVLINTIGIGTVEGGEFANLTVVSTLDEDTLKKITASTGGSYYRASDRDSLIETFKRITLISREKISKDLSAILLFIGLLLLFMEWGLINTKYKIIP